MFGIGWGGQHGVMAARVEAKQHFGLWRFFDAEALRADRHAAIAAHLDDRAHAPDIIPPRAAGRWPQDRAFFFASLLPGP